ncbi:MAG: histone deacetylase [Gemmatimonadaceae bacterium]|nr:histone deacetylase [Gemmatimonadaceae bacterium]NUR35100.1 histone deacetylase [Gemmatimonadaceae bacterium]NUS34659.1 histone deacetylase [Gemmatimonadaceae bacterium]
MPLTVWSSARYTFPLPEGHRFPVEKYAMLRERVVAEGIVAAERVLDPAAATDDMLRLVHTADYVGRFVRGAMSEAELRRLGFPWSAALVERSRRAVGGTVAAARHALAHGAAMNLAGGTHHAFPDHGEGFCVFNDVAIAIRLLHAEGLVRRVAVIDLDVHQGNGTHAIFAGDPAVYTFSMHGRRNYPFEKVAGTMDIDLEDGTEDAEYLARLGAALPRVLHAAQPDLVVYLAGADPHERDRLGRMKLTFAGLERRDGMVLASCREVGLPVAVVIAGGYGARIEDTVAAHVATARIAAASG